MLENVQQHTLQPFIQETIELGTIVSAGEYARDEDGDGFHEVHVNTMEGFWSLLRSWLRPHRGISQEKLPIYLGFFEFVHNVRQRGRALLGSLLDTLLQPVACPQNPI